MTGLYKYDEQLSQLHKNLRADIVELLKKNGGEANIKLTIQNELVCCIRLSAGYSINGEIDSFALFDKDDRLCKANYLSLDDKVCLFVQPALCLCKSIQPLNGHRAGFDSRQWHQSKIINSYENY